MNKTLEKLEATRKQVRNLEEQFLRENGWEYVCVFCYWLWTKNFPADEVLKRPPATFLCSQNTAISIQNMDDSLHSEDEGE